MKVYLWLLSAYKSEHSHSESLVNFLWKMHIFMQICMKSSLSTEHIWQTVINVLTPFSSTGTVYPFLSFLPKSSAYSESAFMLLWIRKGPSCPSFTFCHLRPSVVSSHVLFVYKAYLVVYALSLLCIDGICARGHCHFLSLLPVI